MTCSNFTKHASGSGGKLRAEAQKVGWQESLGRWAKVGLLAGVALGSALPTTGFSEPIVMSGLVAYYPCNGNANDTSGNNNHGSPTSVTYTTDRRGELNSACSFSGSSYIQITGKRFNLSENTLVGWVKWNGSAIDSSRSYGIVSNYSGSNKNTSGLQQYGLKMASVNGSGGNYASFFYDDGAAGATGFKGVTSASPLSDGKWHFLAAVFKGGTEADIYVDGIKYVNLSSQVPPISISPSNDLYIGRDGSAGDTKGGLNWKGVIDDVRLYNRALTVDEITQLFQVIELANGTTFIPNSDGSFKVLDSEYPMTVTEKADGSFLVKATKRFSIPTIRSVRGSELFDIDPTTMEATITSGDGGISVVDTTTPHLTSTFNQDGTTVVTDSISGMTGTMKDGKITVKDNENPTMTATFDVNSGKGTVFTDSEFPTAAVTFNPNGTYSVTDTELPTSTATINPNGTVTVADTELPGAQMTLNGNGTLTVVDPESPSTTVTFNENGTQTITDEEYPGMVATVDENENYTITDQEFPNVVLTVNNDGTYTMDDGHECLVATADELENTRSVRGFLSGVKNFFKKAGGLIKKVVKVVKKVVSVVKKVVSKIVPIVKKFFKVGLSFVKKVAGFFKGFGTFLQKAWCYLKCYVFPAIKGLITKILPVLAPVAIIAGIAGVAIVAYKVIKFLKAKNQQQIQYVEETVEVAEQSAQPVVQQGEQIEDNLPPPSEGQSTLPGTTKSRPQDAGRGVREATSTLNCPRQPLPEIFTNPEMEDADTSRGTLPPLAENQVGISTNDSYLVVTPNPGVTEADEKEMEFTENADGTVTGTNGLVSVKATPNTTGATANENDFSISMKDASPLNITANADGSYKVVDTQNPDIETTLNTDGTATINDAAVPGITAIINADGSSTLTDTTSPAGVVINNKEGHVLVTSTASPNMVATLNNDGSTTVVDSDAPSLAVTLKDGEDAKVVDTSSGLSATVSNDASVTVTDPQTPDVVTTFKPDGSYQVTDATGTCLTDDSQVETGVRRNTRGFFSKIASLISLRQSFVGQVRVAVATTSQFVNVVKPVVNLGYLLSQRYTPIRFGLLGIIPTRFWPWWKPGLPISYYPCPGPTTYPWRLFKKVVWWCRVQQVAQQATAVVEADSLPAPSVSTQVRSRLAAVRATPQECPVLPPVADTEETGTGTGQTGEVAGKYTASGTLKDKLGPVANATVQIAGKTATTDASGHWEITGLTAGNYTAEATKEGYLSLIQQFEVSEALPKATVPFKLASLLKVQVSTQPKVAKQGDNVTYLINITNNGTHPATGLVLQDVIPNGTTLVSLEGDNCEANTVSCTLADLAPGTTTKVTLVVTAPEAGKQQNTAKVAANDYPAEVVVTTKEIMPSLFSTTRCTPNPVPMLEGLHCVVTVNLSTAATTPATGVKVVTTLPTNVALQAATTDLGTCDASQFPTVTCTLQDLNSTVNQATLNFEMTLTDPGLLALTQETTVSSDNYGSHTSRARATIQVPPEIQVDLALVIDITGSMQGEIDGAKTALKNFIATLDSASAPLVALIAFKDDVSVKAFTRDMTVLLKAIESLKAEGGGTCPEASVEAVEVAALHVKPGGIIWFSTDASPYPDAEVQPVLDLMVSKNIRFNATVTGDCTSADSANNDQWQQVVNGK